MILARKVTAWNLYEYIRPLWRSVHISVIALGYEILRPCNCHNPSFFSLALVMLLYSCQNRPEPVLKGRKGETWFCFCWFHISMLLKSTCHIKLHLWWLLGTFCIWKIWKVLLEKLSAVNWPDVLLSRDSFLFTLSEEVQRLPVTLLNIDYGCIYSIKTAYCVEFSTYSPWPLHKASLSPAWPSLFPFEYIWMVIYITMWPFSREMVLPTM